MRPTAFAAPGRFYRGNLHTHSNHSDGSLPPDEVCRRYAGAGYDFLCLSDHFVGQYGYPITDTTGYRRDGFTTLLGAELHSGALANGELWHLLAVGLPADFAPSDSPGFKPHPGQESGAAIAERARAAGAFVVLAHPEWYGLTLADALPVEAAHAIEVHNSASYVECDRGGGAGLLDQLLNAGRSINPIAADDAHFRGTTPDHFGGWVMVKAEANVPETLLAALKSGQYYSSTGAELRDIEISETHIRVACSPAARVTVVGHHTAAAAVQGHALTEATLPIERFKKGGWLRVTVIDAAGKRAWSNPIRLD
ncbi:MAG: CehA/McbA family metallohydrolase [Pseudomonadota bacterium]